MTAPVTIPDLDPAGPIDPANDLLLIRQGLNDRKVAAGLLSNPSLDSLDFLPGQLVASDVLLIGRNNGVSYDNYIMPPQYLGFLNGTRMWFYQGTAPLGWTLIPNTGDRLLAVSDSFLKYNGVNAPNQTGDWQQAGHVLTKGEMPVHSHNIIVADDSGTSNITVSKGRTANAGSYRATTAEGSSQAHNHGFTWRPLANVGILCVKDKQIGQ